MRLRALAAGAVVALLTPVLAAAFGHGWGWLFNGLVLAGVVAGALAGGSMRRGFGHATGAGLLALVVTAGLVLVVWVSSLLGLFGEGAARGAVHFVLGLFMTAPLVALALPFLALGVLFLLGAMGVGGAVGAAIRSSW